MAPTERWDSLPLHVEHIAELRASGVSYEVARARGYRTITKTVEAETLGFKRYQAPMTRMPGLLVPMYSPGTDKMPASHQIKMASPRRVRGRDLKYETPSGLANVLDLNPMHKDAASDPSRRLWVVEGVKKADCLNSRGEVAVGIAGVWAWRGTNSAGGKTALAGFDGLALNGREVVVCFDSDALEKAQVRNAMERLVHYLRARGAKANFLVVPGAGDGKTGADDFLAAGGTVTGLLGHATFGLPEKPKTRLPLYEEVVDLLDGYRYVLDWGKWLQWDGRRWRLDTAKHELVEGAVMEIVDPDRKAIIGRENSLQWVTSIRRAMQTDALGFHVTSEMLDARPHLLNVANGTVDLRTGALSQHNPEDMLTKITKGAYRPGHRNHDVDALTSGTVPEDCRDYLQRVFGYAMYGEVSEEIFPVLGGRGANGKTTLLSAMSAALGDYADAANTKLIMAGNSEHATIEADLFGMRLVYLAETGEEGVLAMDRVKTLTGGDRRKARRMREDYWSFTPTHTLILATNYPPKVESNDYGTWRRLRLIPFPYKFTSEPVHPDDRKGDPHLRHRARTQQVARDAMVTYCVTGAVHYSEHGLGETPLSVSQATDKWREECDTFGAFLKECCVVESGARIDQSRLAQVYNEWEREHGRRERRTTTWVKTQLENLASEYGFHLEFKKSNSVRWIHGLRIADDGERPRIVVAQPEKTPHEDWYSDALEGMEPEVSEWLGGGDRDKGQ